VPFPNPHSARLRDPDAFDEDTLVTLSENFPTGVTAIAGKLKGEDAVTLQAIRFAVEDWTPDEAREWMEKHPDLGEVLAFEDASGEEEKAEIAEHVCILTPLPEALREQWEAMQEEAQEALGDRFTETEWDEPHVTILYLGSTPAASLDTIKEQTDEVLAKTDPGKVTPSQVIAFPMGDDGTPIVVRMEDGALEDVNVALLRALASHIEQQQFPEYNPHLTLGYLPREVTDKERKALGKLPMSVAPWTVEEIELRADSDVTETFVMKADEVDDGPGSVSDKGMASEVRDRFRHARLVVLDDDALVEAHDLVHELFSKREEDANTAGFANAHLATLRVLADRELDHPEPLDDTEELDALSTDATMTKTMVVTHVWLSKSEDGRPDVVYMVVHVPFEVDGQGDWFDDRDVLDMAHVWALEGFKLNLEHDKIPGLRLKPGEAHVVESATAPVTFIVNEDGEERPFIPPALFGDTEIPDALVPFTRADADAGDSLIPKTSWIIAVKAAGRVLEWFAAGKLTGPSLQGPAAKVFDNRPDALRAKYP